MPEQNSPEITGITNQTEVVPQNLHLEFSREIRLLQTVLKLPRLAEQFEEESFLQQALEVTENLTDSQISFIHFVNDDEQSIELITWSRRTLEYYCNAVYDKHYPVAQAGIWADALREKRPVIFNDYASYKQKRGLPDGHALLKRLISLPVMNEGKVVMLTGVGNKPTDYNDTDVETLQIIANEIWNIAQRRRYLTALKNQEKLFRVTFEQAAVGLAQLSPQGQFILVNQSFCDITGYSDEELMSLTFQDITHPEDLQADLAQVESLLQGKSHNYALEKRYSKLRIQSVQ